MDYLPMVSHAEWCCRDLDKSVQFFSDLFGWSFKRFSQNYALYTPPQEGVAVGLMQREDFTPGNGCMVFIQVKQIETFLNLGIGLGGKLIVPKTEISEYGNYAQLTDLDGNIVGLFEAES